MNPTESDDLHELMLRHLEGETSSEEARQLTLALRNSPEAQRQFAELLVQMTQLRTLGVEQNILALDRLKSPRVNVWRSAGARWALAAAACLVAVASLFFLTRLRIGDYDKQIAEDSNSVANADTVATLTRSAALVWDSPTNVELEVGASLDPGLLRLKSGVAELEFISGARVILEGPAEFELISDQEGRLNFGKLRAQVPEPAHGFKVYTPQITVTDLGTEFALNEQPNQPPEVHVFVGKVQLEFDNTNRAPVELVAGEGAKMDAGKLRNIPANQQEFIAPEELQRRETTELRSRYEEWKKNVASFAADPALLVYFNFEHQRTNGQVLNRADFKQPGTDGKTMGTQWTSGRWPDKVALQFTDRPDRVHLKVPGQFDSLTYSAWVSIDNLSRPNNALAMSQTFKPGDVRWDISSAGSLRLAVRSAERGDAYETVTSPRVLKSKSKRWVHLAAVYDGAGKTIALYLNGKRIASKAIVQPVSLVLQDVELGNWNPLLNRPASASERKERQKPSFKFREFQGRMDEFALLSRPLSADEIRKLYETGKPRSETTVSAHAKPQK